VHRIISRCTVCKLSFPAHACFAPRSAPHTILADGVDAGLLLTRCVGAVVVLSPRKVSRARDALRQPPQCRGTSSSQSRGRRRLGSGYTLSSTIWAGTPLHRVYSPYEYTIHSPIDLLRSMVRSSGRALRRRAPPPTSTNHSQPYLSPLTRKVARGTQVLC